MKTLLPFLLLAFSIKRGYSQDLPAIETDRPDQTECSSVLPPNTLQVETGIVRETDMNSSTLFVPTTLIRLGISNKIEFRVIAGEYYFAENKDTATATVEKGFSPFSIGTKIFICEEKKIIPQTAVLFHLNHDNTRFSFNQVEYDFRFSMAHTLSKRMDLGYNLGGEWNKNEDTFNWIYTLTGAYALSCNLGIYIEVFGAVARNKLPTHQLDGGITFLLRKNIQLDCSAGIALNKNSPDRFISAGISWRIPK